MRLAHLFRLLVLTAALALVAGCDSAAPVQEITVTAKDYRYTPDKITVNAGQKVRIKFVNADTVEHDVSAAAAVQLVQTQGSSAHAGHGDMAMGAIAPLHLHTDANTTATIEFTPQNKGTYELFCSVTGHKEQGMVGTVIVQ
ncbi:MAG: cupredoxin domain-containing protein [Chloroflexi bacterium]|nr:cupredoxin domain-containing protein [Chloroflexota bacterium]